MNDVFHFDLTVPPSASPYSYTLYSYKIGKYLSIFSGKYISYTSGSLLKNIGEETPISTVQDLFTIVISNSSYFHTGTDASYELTVPDYEV